jgi:hypothetical protein
MKSTKRQFKTLNSLLTKRYLDLVSNAKKRKLTYLSKEEFFAIAYSKEHSQKLNQLFQNYINNDYNKKLSPSVDRISPNLGYIPSNIQFMTISENIVKGNKERHIHKKNKLIKSL